MNEEISVVVQQIGNGFHVLQRVRCKHFVTVKCGSRSGFCCIRGKFEKFISYVRIYQFASDEHSLMLPYLKPLNSEISKKGSNKDGKDYLISCISSICWPCGNIIVI